MEKVATDRLEIQPKVSIIVPIFNRAHTIDRALRSAVDQTYQNTEIVLVDDGSTDALTEVLAGFPDPRIRLLRHASNKGAAAARNTGILAASGDLIAFLDSDDAWHPDKIALQVASLAKGADDVIGICSGFSLIWQGTGRVVHRVPEELRGPECLLSGCDISPGSTLIVRRPVFDRVGLLDTDFPRLEDWDWLLRALREGRVLVQPQPLASIYVGGWPSFASVEASVQRLIERNLDWLAARDPANRSRLLASCRYELSVAAFHARRYGAAMLHLFCYLYYAPIEEILSRLRHVLNGLLL